MATTSFYLQKIDLTIDQSTLPEQLTRLPQHHQNLVFGKVWELAKMEDATVDGVRWGEKHSLDSLPRLQKAMHRLGLLDRSGVVEIEYLTVGAGASYSALMTHTQELTQGRVSYVNGGSRDIWEMSSDAIELSKHIHNDLRIYLVHHHSISGTFLIRDQTKVSKTACLLAQQMVDFLDENPDKKYLQIAHLEGAIHTLVALRLINTHRSELLHRIRVLTFAPSHYITKEDFKPYPHGLQVINIAVSTRSSSPTILSLDTQKPDPMRCYSASPPPHLT